MELYSVGNTLRIGLFGKSHAESIGCYIDGLPMGMEIDPDNIARAMDLRKPKSGIGTPRKEKDEAILEEGVEDGKVTGRVLIRIMNGIPPRTQVSMSPPDPATPIFRRLSSSKASKSPAGRSSQAG